MIRVAAIGIACALVLGCAEQGPPLAANDILIYAPLPGNDQSVAYLTLRNQSSKSITVRKISSPQFGDVEIHETLIVDGVAKMEQLKSLTIRASEAAEFTAGGRHIMLQEPRRNLTPGQAVRLTIHFGDDGVLFVDAPLQERRANQAPPGN